LNDKEVVSSVLGRMFTSRDHWLQTWMSKMGYEHNRSGEKDVR